MAKWNKEGVPHKGWVCVGMEDIIDEETPADERVYEACEMCSNPKIRYVHIMSHDEHISELRVGCVCAGKMEDDYEQAQTRENVLKRKSANLKSALKRAKEACKRDYEEERKHFMNRWSYSQNGNYSKNHNGEHVLVFQKNGKWKAKVGNTWGRKVFDSDYEVKSALLEHFYPQSMLEDRIEAKLKAVRVRYQ